MSLPEGAHLELMQQAIATEGAAQRALLAGDGGAARDGLREAARLYRASWEAAPPGSYGRLIGMLKAAVIAGDGPQEAAYARGQIEAGAQSRPAAYARAIAALIDGDDGAARAAAAQMHGGSPAFENAAAAIDALAAGDAQAYAGAVAAIVADFEARHDHLTGVPIADTALMLERLAERRGLSARASSPLLPSAG